MMSSNNSKFKLPGKVERCLATLSTMYGQQDNLQQFRRIIVNAKVNVEEEWSYDNWDGGTYGHALHLIIPASLYPPTADQKSEIQDQIRIDLNQLHNTQNEFVAAVFLEMEVEDNSQWRQESGLLVKGKKEVPPDVAERIWGNQGFRLFLSHKADVKQKVARLKERLRLFGLTGFVAHEDIQPTKAWQDEIEYALASMDGLIALMTESFHNSDWTDQEVGFAVARGVPIIPVRLGTADPYGFIGRFQALSCSWEEAPVEIVKLLIHESQVFDGYVQALRNVPNWNVGNELAEVLPGIKTLTQQQINALVAAYNETTELRGCFGFNGSKPTDYGRGLVWYLNRLGTKEYTFSNGLISEEEEIPF